jgi:hypothetical protein
MGKAKWASAQLGRGSGASCVRRAVRERRINTGVLVAGPGALSSTHCVNGFCAPYSLCLSNQKSCPCKPSVPLRVSNWMCSPLAALLRETPGLPNRFILDLKEVSCPPVRACGRRMPCACSTPPRLAAHPAVPARGARTRSPRLHPPLRGRRVPGECRIGIHTECEWKGKFIRSGADGPPSRDGMSAGKDRRV